MTTLTDLQAQLVKLKKARGSGAKSVSYDNRMVTFRDITELNNAIAQVEADIALAGGAIPIRTFRFTSSKDL